MTRGLLSPFYLPVNRQNTLIGILPSCAFKLISLLAERSRRLSEGDRAAVTMEEREI